MYRLRELNILKKIRIIKGEASDSNFCKKIISTKINEIYFLSGYSSVVGSFNKPDISLKSNVLGLVNILEIIKNKKFKIKLFNAGSGQFFGDNKKNLYNINSKLVPQSPYGVSKAASYWLTDL